MCCSSWISCAGKAWHGGCCTLPAGVQTSKLHQCQQRWNTLKWADAGCGKLGMTTVHLRIGKLTSKGSISGQACLSTRGQGRDTHLPAVKMPVTLIHKAVKSCFTPSAMSAAGPRQSSIPPNDVLHPVHTLRPTGVHSVRRPWLWK